MKLRCRSCGATMDTEDAAASLGYAPGTKVSSVASLCSMCGGKDLEEVHTGSAEAVAGIGKASSQQETVARKNKKPPGGMVRIALGSLIIALFLAGLGGGPPNMGAYILVGAFLFLIPGGLLILFGWRARRLPGRQRLADR